MASMDLTPLMRSTVGFDRLWHVIDDIMRQARAAEHYPPYNIAKRGENTYRIEIAVSGFGIDDLEVSFEPNELLVKGRAPQAAEGERLHHGWMPRDFERRFHLADHVEVTGASLVDGLLSIDLRRELPEALKPRKIEIGTGSSRPERRRRLEAVAA